jgi:hypothetical protein
LSIVSQNGNLSSFCSISRIDVGSSSLAQAGDSKFSATFVTNRAGLHSSVVPVEVIFCVFQENRGEDGNRDISIDPGNANGFTCVMAHFVVKFVEERWQ